jgi:hypothetical protein
MPSGDRPFLCGLQVGQPQCPQLFDCIVQPGMCCPLCKKFPFLAGQKQKKEEESRNRASPAK